MADERVRVVVGQAPGAWFTVDGELLIGRAASHVDGRLGDDPELSRSHARMARGAGGALTIEDLGSSNGTFVNGERVEGVRVLRLGDVVRVGTTELAVTDERGLVPEATRTDAPAPAPVAVPEGLIGGDGVALAAPGSGSGSGGRLLLAGTVGALVALSLGLYGNVHDPASDLSITLGFEDTITMKVWLATLAVVFAVVQLGSALWMYGKRPLGAAPAWLGSLHRISGRVAFLLTLPVAYQCLYGLTFEDTSTRVLLHSLLGCAFYGAFAAKIVVVRSHALPGMALPLAGGVLFTLLVAVWLTSGWWFISDNGFPSP
jgi:pSer/pThr/pTyr-binding forkhead associated (FHA) protein